ncbi:kinetochore protein SPC25 homolog [Bidens hawaiensis]|uniref:kinetochore protein SPC25 homolog n=1 Tax=Bidens hawaiensis TaxID=980011 RepID=UPI00404AA8E1
MQSGIRPGDRKIKDKMAEIRMICGKEIEIQQTKFKNAELSLQKTLQPINSTAQETVLNEGKIGTLKAQLRAVEDDLVKAIAAKTRKESQKMAIADSISDAKARVEELKKIVVDQRTRKEQYAEIISHQSEALKECEEKHEQDAGRREEIEEAISWYNKVLGFRIERGRGIKFIFTNINMKKPDEEYFFTIRLENDSYCLLECYPHVTEVNKLIEELNITNGLYNFVRIMRTKFQEMAADGNLHETASHPQETIISMSAPISSVSTDSGSASSAKKNNLRQADRVSRKARHVQGVQSFIQSPASASSFRRLPRFKVQLLINITRFELSIYVSTVVVVAGNEMKMNVAILSLQSNFCFLLCAFCYRWQTLMFACN